VNLDQDTFGHHSPAKDSAIMHESRFKDEEQLSIEQRDRRVSARNNLFGHSVGAKFLSKEETFLDP